MLGAWCLNTCQTHPQREAAFGRLHKGGGGLRPPPPLWNPLCMGLAGVQASSTKHQASSIKLLGYEAWSGAHDIFLGTSWSTTETFPFLHFYYPWISHGFSMDFPLSFPLFFPWFLHGSFHGFPMNRFSMICPWITKCFPGGFRYPSWRKKTK